MKVHEAKVWHRPIEYITEEGEKKTRWLPAGVRVEFDNVPDQFTIGQPVNVFNPKTHSQREYSRGAHGTYITLTWKTGRITVHDAVRPVIQKDTSVMIGEGGTPLIYVPTTNGGGKSGSMTETQFRRTYGKGFVEMVLGLFEKTREEYEAERAA